jgi:hypothetical protein
VFRAMRMRGAAVAHWVTMAIGPYEAAAAPVHRRNVFWRGTLGWRETTMKADEATRTAVLEAVRGFMGRLRAEWTLPVGGQIQGVEQHQHRLAVDHPLGNQLRDQPVGLVAHPLIDGRRPQ